MAMMAMMTVFTFTSCEDEEIAYTLEGTWEGQMYTESVWGGTRYETGYTEVTFLRDPHRYAKGNGYWVDHLRGYTPWRTKYYANHISWRVENGNIIINFIEDRTSAVIRNYRLNDNHFSGEIEASDGTWCEFYFRHTSSPNWNDYVWGNGYDDYGYGYDYYWAKTRSAEQSDSVKTELPRRVIAPAK